MLETMEQQQHVTDGDLIRLLDDETTPADAELGSHVAGCAQCSGRLARLRQRSQQVTAALRLADVPLADPARLRPPLDQVSVARFRARRRPVRLWMRPSLRAAAALLLLAGAAAASPTGRAWIRDHVTRLRGSPVPPARVEPRPTEQNAPRSVGAIVRFVPPSGSELTVRFDERPAAGSLEIARGDDVRAAAQVIARAGSETLLVLPGELRVRNSAASTADYRITLPRSVRRVRVYVGPGAMPLSAIDVPDGDTIRLTDPIPTPPRR
jgi:hypothetical protein